MTKDGDMRVEEWMVSEAWLKEHATCCDKTSKIRENPAGWGGEDPGAINERFGRMREEKEVYNAKKRKAKESKKAGSSKAKKGSGSKKQKRGGNGKGKARANESDDDDDDFYV